MNNPAKYNKRIAWEEKGRVQNKEGHWVTEWTSSDLGISWAQIRTIRGKEFILAGAEQAKIFTRINMRYRKDVEDKYYKLGEKLRLKLGDRIYAIEYLNNLEEKNIELEIIANEVR